MPNALALKQQAVELQREVSEKLKSVDEGGITVAEFSQYMENATKQGQGNQRRHQGVQRRQRNLLHGAASRQEA
jgi:hypothetical protein